jgi:hypothetical protein
MVVLRKKLISLQAQINMIQSINLKNIKNFIRRLCWHKWSWQYVTENNNTNIHLKMRSCKKCGKKQKIVNEGIKERWQTF